MIQVKKEGVLSEWPSFYFLSQQNKNEQYRIEFTIKSLQNTCNPNKHYE